MNEAYRFGKKKKKRRKKKKKKKKKELAPRLMDGPNILKKIEKGHKKSFAK